MTINTGTTGVYLPEQTSSEIWAAVQEQSIVQRLARRIDMPGSGVSVTRITGDVEAAWVSELGNKPYDDATLAQKVLTPYKAVVAELFSTEFEQDLPAVYNALVARLPGAIAKRFDTAILGGTTPGAGFDVLTAAPAISVDSNVYQGLVQAIRQVDAAGGELSAFILNGAGEAEFLGAIDGVNRPLFTLSPANDGSVGNLVGRPTYRSRHVGGADVVGYAGDWSAAMWGQVGGLQIRRFDQAFRGIDLSGTNQVAYVVEARLAFGVEDVSKFVRLTATGAGSSSSSSSSSSS